MCRALASRPLARGARVWRYVPRCSHFRGNALAWDVHWQFLRSVDPLPASAVSRASGLAADRAVHPPPRHQQHLLRALAGASPAPRAPWKRYPAPARRGARPRLLRRGYVGLLLPAGPRVRARSAAHGIAGVKDLARLVTRLRRSDGDAWEKDEPAA